MKLALISAAFFFAATPSPLDQARDRQDANALSKLLDTAAASAQKSPNDAQAQYQAALAASYLAAVHIELHERKPARDAAERGIVFGEKAVALKPGLGEYYRVLGTLYGQAVTDLMSGFRNGPKAKEAIAKAVEKSPKSSSVYVARGVGNLYLPAQLGGGAEAAIPDFRKAIEIDSKNAEAWVYLGVALRNDKKEDEARQAFNKALELNPNRFWVRQLLAKSPGEPGVRDEIEKIRTGRYAPLPPAQRSAGATTPGKTTITVKNSTTYALSLFFDGPVSTKLILSPGAAQDLDLAPGTFRVAGRVAAAGVLPFYGEETYAGSAHYSVTFYIGQ